MNRAAPDGIRLVEQSLVTAVEVANGVMVGVNRESGSAGSAAWNFAAPKATRSCTGRRSASCSGGAFAQLVESLSVRFARAGLDRFWSNSAINTLRDGRAVKSADQILR